GARRSGTLHRGAPARPSPPRSWSALRDMCMALRSRSATLSRGRALVRLGREGHDVGKGKRARSRPSLQSGKSTTAPTDLRVPGSGHGSAVRTIHGVVPNASRVDLGFVEE